MKGIPVDMNGDPLRPVIVFARNYREFRVWADASGVRANSHNVVWASSLEKVQGRPECDIVAFGLWHEGQNAVDLTGWAIHHKAKYPGTNSYTFSDGSSIQPDVRQ